LAISSRTTVRAGQPTPSSSCADRRRDRAGLLREEHGQSLPPLDCLIALAEPYDVTPAALLDAGGDGR
jgi:hypothetical protein